MSQSLKRWTEWSILCNHLNGNQSRTLFKPTPVSDDHFFVSTQVFPHTIHISPHDYTFKFTLGQTLKLIILLSGTHHRLAGHWFVTAISPHFGLSRSLAEEQYANLIVHLFPTFNYHCAVLRAAFVWTFPNWVPSTPARRKFCRRTSDFWTFDQLEKKARMVKLRSCVSLGWWDLFWTFFTFPKFSQNIFSTNNILDQNLLSYPINTSGSFVNPRATILVNHKSCRPQKRAAI